MGMANADTIDIVAMDRTRGKLLLVMTEHRRWNGERMRTQLHYKTNTYARHALGAQFTHDHPGLTAKDVIIKLDCAHRPGQKTLTFIEWLRKGLARYGIGFEYEVCG
jgi:hypothetical protein